MEMALHLPPTPSGDAYVTAEKLQEKQKLYPLDIMLCRDCGHSQLSVVVDPEILYKNYIYTTSISLGLSDHFKEYAKSELKKIKPAKGAFVLDIGSNDGTLLAHFKSYGLKVLGVDPAPSIKTIAEGRGVKTLTGYFNSRLAEKIKKDKGPASIITANNVFANIDDLSTALKNDFLNFSTKLATYREFSLVNNLGKTYLRTYDNIIMKFSRGLTWKPYR
jgi:hypothetical protein